MCRNTELFIISKWELSLQARWHSSKAFPGCHCSWQGLSSANNAMEFGRHWPAHSSWSLWADLKFVCFYSLMEGISRMKWRGCGLLSGFLLGKWDCQFCFLTWLLCTYQLWTKLLLVLRRNGVEESPPAKKFSMAGVQEELCLGRQKVCKIYILQFFAWVFWGRLARR